MADKVKDTCNRVFERLSDRWATRFTGNAARGCPLARAALTCSILALQRRGR